MSIKVQPFIIDAAVLDLIGNEFKFDHAKGLSEWLKNSADAYLRQGVHDHDQFIVIRVRTSDGARLRQIECIDFVGMTKLHIEDAFRRFFDPQAARKFANRQEQIKTLGGHGNGGKFYMRQMFKTSQAICYRDGRINIFGFNEHKRYGFDDLNDNRKISLNNAMKIAGITSVEIPDKIRNELESNKTGFTVIRGDNPVRVTTTPTVKTLIDRIIIHPQARRLIEKKHVCLLIDEHQQPTRLSPPRIHPKAGFETPFVVPIPHTLKCGDVEIPFTSEQYPKPGCLVLKTSNDPLRGISRAPLNVIDFIGDVGVIASYPVAKLGGLRAASMVEFIYGECLCPILEDSNDDCVRNDRQQLIEDNVKTQAIMEWVRDEVEKFAQSMEDKSTAEKRQRDLKNTSEFNRILNAWKDRFLNKLLVEMTAGKGPAGISGNKPGGGGSSGSGGKGITKQESSTGNRSGDLGGSLHKKHPRFPKVLISGQDKDPLDANSSVAFECDPRHPAIYQRMQDVAEGIYWINTSRPLAQKILYRYTADDSRWREYVFQRYVDIIVREAIFLLGKEEPSLSADVVSRKVDDVTTKIHDQAASDLDKFLFEDRFNV